MERPTNTAIIESLLRVYEKPDEGSLTIPCPALLINWEFFPSLFKPIRIIRVIYQQVA